MTSLIEPSTSPTVHDKRRKLEQLLRDRLTQKELTQKELTQKELAQKELAQQESGGDPLSVGQQALWFLNQFDPGNGSYNIGHGLILRSELDPAALQTAVDRLVERHPALRTTFRTGENGPESVVHHRATVQIADFDGTGLDDDAVVTALAAEADRPFDLTTGPLLRITRCRRGADTAMLMLVLHHIVGEFWALVIVVRDLLELYDAEVTGRPARLPILTADYADFARWQRSLLDSEEGDRLADYWLAQMAGPLPALDLPTDRPRPPEKTHRGGQRSFDLGAAVSAAVKDFAAGKGVTVYTTLLATFGAFLSRYSGQRDLVVGAPMTGRTESRWTDVVGFFDNPLPLRLTLDVGTTFEELVAKVHSTVLGAFEHQAMPFSTLVQKLQPVRDPSRSPLFDVMFVLRRAQAGRLQTLAAADMGENAGTVALGSGISAEPVDLDRHTSQFDLSLSVTEVGSDLRAVWEFNRDLFDDATIDRMSGHFRAFLEGLVSAPDTPVAVVPLLPADEQRQALVEWNATDAPLDESATLIDGFLDHVRRHPDLPAVVAGDARLSYAELYDRAARISTWLRSSGARPNTLVAVVMTKGWEQVAATLGVLMAGAAYLPLDPGLPNERLRHLLDVGEVELLLTTPDLEQDLGWTAPRPMLLVDDLSPAGWPADPPAAAPGHHDLAYVIFTSGSTGVPKGVAIDHAGAVNTIIDINERFQVGVGDRVLGLSALSFDLSVWDIFGTLAAGATLILPDARSTQDPVHWLELARREHVTIWNSVPMLLKLLVDELDQDVRQAMDGLESLRLAMLSGDWIPVTLPDQVWSHLPDISLVSLGGATEASIWSILHPIASVDSAHSSIPYGRPMRNQQIYVLDDGYSPCPIGVTGRLFIGGIGLAREYWRDDARTNASFPISPRTGQRLYHTGDLGRYLPDGTIEFLGRADHQVKVRGFRVELGEVEAALLAHPGVREAAVAARGRSGENRLIGYVVGVTDADALDLRDWCAARLPDYMVPAVIEVLAELPLSSNGKVDRGKLPEPGLSRRVPPPEHARPRDEKEALLADIWTELLKVEPIGRDENFFELGGDSVLAMRFCTRLRRGGLQLTPRMVFEHPTIAGLAELAAAAPVARGADRQRTDADGADAGRADAGRADASGALAPMQQTMLLHKLYDTSPGLYVEHVIVELNGEIDVAILSRACAAVTGRHGVLRSAFRWDGLPTPLRIELPAEPDPIEVLDWTGLDGDGAVAALTSIVEHDRAAGFDLTEPPLMTWRLVRRGPGRWDLVWAHSHLIVDGWSITLVLRELLADYRALSAGHAPVARSCAQHEDFLAWLGRQDRDADHRFWQQELTGFHAPTALPMLRPPTATGFRHGQRSRRMPVGGARRLTEFTRSRAVTLGTLVQAAWAILLARYSGESDVLFGLTVSGRPADLIGVEDMVGLFINTVPLRLHVPADAEVGAWLATVQAQQMNLRDHDHVSLSEIEGWSDMPRSSRSFSLFDTILVVENYPVDDATPDAGGVHIGQVRFEEQNNTPLMLYVIPDTGDLELRATFDASRLSDAAADRLLGHLEELLTGLAAAPTGRVRDLRMLSDRELAGLPGRAALAPAPAPNATLHGLVAAIADTNPDAVAVSEAGREISYGHLWRSAVAEADRLRSQGCGPGSRVAVLVDRSAEVILAQLAVLIAGAAYVPLDPAQPARYIETVLKDAGAEVSLAGAGLEQRLPSGTRVLSPTWLDGPDAEQAAVPRTGPGSSAQAAYVIYTSGSTGQPKGVVVDHGAARSFVTAAADRYGVEPTDRVLQFCSLGFDASVEEIYVTLAAGATVVPRSDAMVQSIPGFLDGCARSGVTVLDLPTAFWHEVVLAMAGGAQLPASVRMVIVGGERVLATRLAQWRRHAPAGIRLLNTYGPTEAAVVATMAVLAGGTDGAGCASGHEVQGSAPDDDPDAAVPIGYPLPNSTVHVVDIHGQPTPIEVPGELLIGGHGLAREYLGLPQLTAEAFGAHPSDPTAGRIYATGDLVLRRTDGSLTYVGRRDEQIKISGFRVEPAGVESVLEEHPDIRSAVVVPSFQPQGTRLVAHVVPNSGASRPSDRELRSFLADRLAVHLLPASYVWLDDLPRSPSGKIDRKALRESVTAPVAQPTAASCSPLEAELLSVWSAVLGVDVGVNDNFFDLGGQSLQTLQLVQRLSSTLGIEVPVREIFVHPSVTALARELSATGRGLVRLAGPSPSAGRVTEPEPETPPPSAVEPATPHCVTENRPLLSLFAAGRLRPVDSAALTYLPADITDAAGIGRQRVLGEWFQGLPLVHDVLETPLGRLAVIAIPRFSDELYVGQEALVDQLREAVSIAGFIGAKAVSLTGLIPSAIDGGRALPAGPPGSPRVTTGRLTTAAAVALNVERLLADAGRSLAAERLAVLGLGSIGSATLRLLLDCLPHPAEIILCDVYDQAQHLEALRHEAIHEHGYRGRVTVLAGHGEPPAELYRASLIVGATNAPDILDVDRLAPGCIVVDDSAPHCFSPAQALARIERQGDILVSEGGFVESQTALQRTQYWPASTAGLPMIEPIRRWRRHHPTRVTGCMLAGLLEGLESVGGPSSPSWSARSSTIESAGAHFDALVAEGFTGAAAHTEEADLDPALVASFRERFGADELEREAS